MSDGIYTCPMDPMDSIGTTFDPLWTLDDNFLSVLRTATPHVRWNLFVSDGSDGLQRNDFRPPLNAWWQSSKCLAYEQKLHMSDRIYSCPMDPMDSIGTTFDPLWTLDDNFLSVLRTATPHVRWNLFVPDGSDGLHRNDFRPPLNAWWQFSKCLKKRNSTCPMESIRVRWIRWTPSERLSTPTERLVTIF